MCFQFLRPVPRFAFLVICFTTSSAFAANGVDGFRESASVSVEHWLRIAAVCLFLILLWVVVKFYTGGHFLSKQLKNKEQGSIGIVATKLATNRTRLTVIRYGQTEFFLAESVSGVSLTPIPRQRNSLEMNDQEKNQIRDHDETSPPT